MKTKLILFLITILIQSAVYSGGLLNDGIAHVPSNGQTGVLVPPVIQSSSATSQFAQGILEIGTKSDLDLVLRTPFCSFFSGTIALLEQCAGDNRLSIRNIGFFTKIVNEQTGEITEPDTSRFAFQELNDDNGIFIEKGGVIASISKDQNAFNTSAKIGVKETIKFRELTGRYDFLVKNLKARGDGSYTFFVLDTLGNRAQNINNETVVTGNISEGNSETLPSYIFDQSIISNSSSNSGFVTQSLDNLVNSVVNNYYDYNDWTQETKGQFKSYTKNEYDEYLAELERQRIIEDKRQIRLEEARQRREYKKRIRRGSGGGGPFDFSNATCHGACSNVSLHDIYNRQNRQNTYNDITEPIKKTEPFKRKKLKRKADRLDSDDSKDLSKLSKISNNTNRAVAFAGKQSTSSINLSKNRPKKRKKQATVLPINVFKRYGFNYQSQYSALYKLLRNGYLCQQTDWACKEVQFSIQRTPNPKCAANFWCFKRQQFAQKFRFSHLKEIRGTNFKTAEKVRKTNQQLMEEYYQKYKNIPPHLRPPPPVNQTVNWIPTSRTPANNNTFEPKEITPVPTTYEQEQERQDIINEALDTIRSYENAARKRKQAMDRELADYENRIDSISNQQQLNTAIDQLRRLEQKSRQVAEKIEKELSKEKAKAELARRRAEEKLEDDNERDEFNRILSAMGETNQRKALMERVRRMAGRTIEQATEKDISLDQSQINYLSGLSDVNEYIALRNQSREGIEQLQDDISKGVEITDSLVMTMIPSEWVDFIPGAQQVKALKMIQELMQKNPGIKLKEIKKKLIAKGYIEIPWSSGSVNKAAKLLLKGAKDVFVKSKSEAEELFLGLYQGKGYRNATEFDGVGTTQYFGAKKGTYHWDDTLDNDGRIVGHGQGPHGDMKHLQIHTNEGQIIRVFFE